MIDISDLCYWWQILGGAGRHVLFRSDYSLSGMVYIRPDLFTSTL